MLLPYILYAVGALKQKGKKKLVNLKFGIIIKLKFKIIKVLEISHSPIQPQIKQSVYLLGYNVVALPYELS